MSLFVNLLLGSILAVLLDAAAKPQSDIGRGLAAGRLGSGHARDESRALPPR